MQYTENYKLKKPDADEAYTVEDFNENADKIDEALVENKVTADEAKEYSEISKSYAVGGNTLKIHEGLSAIKGYLETLAYGDGKFVMLYYTDLYSSTDFVTWEKCLENVSPSYGYPKVTDITYGKGKFVFANKGSYPSNSYSSDLSSTVTAYGGVYDTYSAIFANDIFVGVGNGLEYSLDGESWSIGTLGDTVNYGSKGLTDITYGDGKFVAVGDVDCNSCYSTDGKTWTAGNAIDDDIILSGVTCGNGIFVAVGYDSESPNNGHIYYSTDGVSWVDSGIAFDSALYKIAYGEGRFVTVTSTGEVYSSTDGVSWSRITSYNDGGSFDEIVYINDTFLIQSTNAIYCLETCESAKQYCEQSQEILEKIRALIGAGMTVNAPINEIEFWSTGGVLSGVPGIINDIAYGDGMFVAVGDVADNGSAIYCSADAKYWSWKSGTANINAIAYGDGKFVAATDTGIIYTDDFCHSWKNGGTISGSVGDIAYGKGKFVATVGDTCIYYSEDCITWIEVNVDAYLTTVAYGDGVFVAGAQGGIVYYSEDGINWTKGVTVANIDSTDILVDMTFGNHMFVASSGNGNLYYIYSGITSGIADGVNVQLNNIAYGRDMFVGIGSDNVVYYSYDGINWVAGININENINGIAYGEGVFVVVGDECIYYSVFKKESKNLEDVIYELFRLAQK